MHLSEAEWALVRGLYIVLASIALIGCISNFSLFYVTVRSKNLRLTCHLLIGLCALLDGLHQLIPQIGLLGGCACELSIGLERLTAVAILSRYRAIGRRHLAAHLLFILSFSLFAVYLMVVYYRPTKQICMTPAPYHGAAVARWGQTIGALNLATITVYCTVAIVVLLRKEMSAATRRSFFSIFFVMISDVCGWTAAIAIHHVAHAMEMTHETGFIVHFACGLFLNAGIAAKPIIYFMTRRVVQMVVVNIQVSAPNIVKLFAQFSLSEQQWLLVRILYIPLVSIASFGCATNFCLFFVTLRSKNLRSTCHLLIGLCALLDTFHQMSQIYQFPLLFGDGTIDSFLCSALQLLPEIGLLCGCACELSIGLERLTAVVLLAQYRGSSRRILTVHLLFISTFACFVVYLMIAYYNPTRQICSTPAPFRAAETTLWGPTIGALNLTTLIVYCTVAIIVYRSNGLSTTTRRSFFSIFFVMTSDVCGWAAAIATYRLVHAMEITSTLQLLIDGLFVNSGIAAKPIIYFTTSSEYRQAFRNVFGLLRITKVASSVGYSSSKSTENVTIVK